MADVALDVNAVNEIVRQAVEGINVIEQGQTLDIQGATAGQQPITLTHPRAVTSLVLQRCSLTQQAQDTLCWYFATRAMSLNHIRLKQMNLGNKGGRRLLFGLHGNNSVTRLDLCSVGSEGVAGGAIISELLQHNPRLTALFCATLRLGVEGVRAFQASLRGNQTMQSFGLGHCYLDDEGISHNCLSCMNQ